MVTWLYDISDPSVCFSLLFYTKKRAYQFDTPSMLNYDLLNNLHSFFQGSLIHWNEVVVTFRKGFLQTFQYVF